VEDRHHEGPNKTTAEADFIKPWCSSISTNEVYVTEADDIQCEEEVYILVTQSHIHNTLIDFIFTLNSNS